MNSPFYMDEYEDQLDQIMLQEDYCDFDNDDDNEPNGRRLFSQE